MKVDPAMTADAIEEQVDLVLLGVASDGGARAARTIGAFVGGSQGPVRLPPATTGQNRSRSGNGSLADQLGRIVCELVTAGIEGGCKRSIEENGRFTTIVS
jgi:hypothetical protein